MKKKDCCPDCSLYSRKTQSLNGTTKDIRWYYYPKVASFLERQWLYLYNAKQAGATDTGKSLFSAENHNPIPRAGYL